MWRNSPCTGTKHSGSVTAISVRSSPWRAWPLTWTASAPECTTSAPRRYRSSMTCPTDHSLPGIGWALMITTSSSPMRSHLFSPVAMSERADIGSPCEPVEITHTSPGGTLSTASMSISTPSGMLMMPSRVPSSTFLPMDRPRVATLRPLATAASMICCTRCMWLAKQATMMRLLALGGEDPAQRHAHRGFRIGKAGLLRVGGVRQEEADTLGLRKLAHARHVGAPAVDRLQVDLEVPRVEDHALRRVECDGHGLGHRVRHRDELDVARRRSCTRLAVRHGNELGLARQAGLFDAVAGQADGQLGAVDRRLDLAAAGTPGRPCGPRGRGSGRSRPPGPCGRRDR